MQGVSSPIGIVGAGAVAKALGRQLYAAGEPVVVLASRILTSAEQAAAFIDPSVQAVSVATIPRLTQRVIIAVVEVVRRLVEIGIPVIGHLGVRPQSVHQLGGYVQRGREPREAEAIVADALDS